MEAKQIFKLLAVGLGFALMLMLMHKVAGCKRPVDAIEHVEKAEKTKIKLTITDKKKVVKIAPIRANFKATVSVDKKGRSQMPETQKKDSSGMTITAKVTDGILFVACNTDSLKAEIAYKDSLLTIKKETVITVKRDSIVIKRRWDDKIFAPIGKVVTVGFIIGLGVHYLTK